MPTLQETFDLVAPALLKQGKKSYTLRWCPFVESYVYSCSYRGDYGLKCAVGHAIPDEDYKPEFEGKPVDIEPVLSYFLGRGFNVQFLNNLQEIHDVRQPADWRQCLEELAQRHGLSTTAIEPPQGV